MKEIKITIVVEEEAGIVGRKEALSFESAADDLFKLERCYNKIVAEREEVIEETEELTGCCDASIVEQTGRCSKCLESV